jgi:hypothetical protein
MTILLPDSLKNQPNFKGKYIIKTNNPAYPMQNIYNVNLTQNTCTCDKYRPYQLDDRGKPIFNAFCTHRTKTLSILSKRYLESEACQADKEKLIIDYFNLLSLQYNPFEVVSAFHKELRFANVERALFFGMILAKFRGVSGVVKYLLNIIFEEARSLNLAIYLNSLLKYPKDIKVWELFAAIEMFCKTKKKWQFEHRLNFLNAEMRGYEQLIKYYGKAVAGGKEIITEQAHNALKQDLYGGFNVKNHTMIQKGLKGLFKSKYSDGHNKLKGKIVYYLDEIATGKNNKFLEGVCGNEIEQIKQYRAFLDERLSTVKEIGYHEINTYCDLLCGEKLEDDANYLIKIKDNAEAKFLENAAKIIDGKYIAIPLYAQDNHTRLGKRYMGVYKREIAGETRQIHIDLRGCGAYFGVAWRHFAFKQFGNIQTPWESVKWVHEKTYEISSQMWY